MKNIEQSIRLLQFAKHFKKNKQQQTWVNEQLAEKKQLDKEDISTVELPFAAMAKHHYLYHTHY